MPTIIWLHRFKKDKRGVSNVIVIVLSLVIVTILVTNVVLWSYQMNQLDWEKMQEKVEITSVTRVKQSLWFTTINEYTVTRGIWIAGTYLDTKTIDGQYEEFTETFAGWYDASWMYRKPIIINNTQNSNSLTDFQVLITIDTASLIAAGKMQLDCDDIRFTNSNGVELISYWIESGINSSNTKIWVKVPYIPASSTTKIYLYFGNPEATSASNINSVLEATYTKVNIPFGWEPRVSTTDVANGDDVGSWQNIPFSFPFWREFKTRVYVCSNGFGIFDPTTPTNDWSNSLSELLQRQKIAPFWDDLRTDVNGGIVSIAGAYIDSHLDHFVITWETTRYGASTDSIKFQAILYASGDIRFNLDNATNFDYFIPTLGISKGDNTNYIDVTNEKTVRSSWLFLLRKYTSPEPTYIVGSEETKSYEFDLVGSFHVDLSAYPWDYIKGLEILLYFKVDDIMEKWFLKAYNWTSESYSDVGFNLTSGHVPTLEWNHYAVNLTETWQSYIWNNGTLLVKFCDEGGDVNQTTVDIDFFGVRVIMNAACFNLKNTGASTSHLVSLWIINSTHHQRYDIDFFLNSGENMTYIRFDISLPRNNFIVKVVTERGNIAAFSVS